MSSELLHECESCGAVIHANEDLYESQMGEVYCKKCATVAIEEGEKGWTAQGPDGERRGAEERLRLIGEITR